MTPELYALAAQIIALPGWEWLPGMRVSRSGSKGIVYYIADGGVVVAVSRWVAPVLFRYMDDGSSDPLASELLPDLTDPATAGAMLGMLSKQLVQAQVTPDGWRVVMVFTDLNPSVSARGATLGEAIARLVVARGGWR